MYKYKPTRNNALFYIIGLLSIINILNFFVGVSIASVVVSVIGLTGVTLFFAGKGAFRYFVWVWIVAQAIIIQHVTEDPETNAIFTNNILDLTQVVHLKVGFYINSDNSSFGIDFNLLVVLYVFLFRIVKTDAWIGKSVDLYFLKNNLGLVVQEGTYLTFTQRIVLSNDDNWLLGELNNEVYFEQKKIDRLAVLTEKGLLCNVFRIIPHDKLLLEQNYSESEFERVEWIVLA